MVNPVVNTKLPLQNIAANPIGEQKIPDAANTKAIPSNEINLQNTGQPQKDTVNLNTKPQVNTKEEKKQEVNTQKNIKKEPDRPQIPTPMNVGVVDPGIPASYQQTQVNNPPVDPQMLAQAGIDPNDPEQLAALGLSPEQMREIATNVGKTGKAGATAVWKAVGVAAAAIGGIALVATGKAKVLWKNIQDSGVIGETIKKTSNYFDDSAKWFKPVTIFDDAGKYAKQSLTGYVRDLQEITKGGALRPDHFRDIKIEFWKDFGPNAPNKLKQVDDVLMSIFEVAKKFSSVDGIVPELKINLSGLSNLDNMFPQMVEEAADLDSIRKLLSSYAKEIKSNKPIGELVESISLTAREAEGFFGYGVKKKNPVVVNIGNNIYLNERADWFRLKAWLGL